MAKTSAETESREQDEPRRRPGGRSARVREAVVAATVAELEESGYEKLSIGAVATRAGVHETSVYRRWKTREGLVTEATYALFAQRITVLDTGSLVEDLVGLLSSTGRLLTSPLGRAAMQFGLALTHDAAITRELHELWAVRMQALRQVFERAEQRGEWPKGADATPLIQGLIGAVYMRVFLMREPVTPKHLRLLVEGMLAPRF